MSLSKNCGREYTTKRGDGVFRSIECRFWHKVNLGGPIPSHRPWLGGCFEWTAHCDRDGYGQFHVDGKKAQAHRWVWAYVHGPLPDGKQVNHKCDNRKCVRPDHLEEGTPKSNSDDKVKKGRQSFGELHGRTKLTEADVIEIRRRYAEGGISMRQLSKLYGMSEASINFIVNRVTWKHIP